MLMLILAIPQIISLFFLLHFFFLNFKLFIYLFIFNEYKTYLLAISFKYRILHSSKKRETCQNPTPSLNCCKAATVSKGFRKSMHTSSPTVFNTTPPFPPNSSTSALSRFLAPCPTHSFSSITLIILKHKLGIPSSEALPIAHLLSNPFFITMTCFLLWFLALTSLLSRLCSRPARELRLRTSVERSMGL